MSIAALNRPHIIAADIKMMLVVSEKVSLNIGSLFTSSHYKIVFLVHQISFISQQALLKKSKPS